MGILLWAAVIFGYIFTCMIAHKVLDAIGWDEAADSPLPFIWPLVILFWLCLGLPIVAMWWLVEKAPKKVVRVAKRAKSKKKVKEVK